MLTGTTGADVLTGGDGDDSISGDDGNDKLTGGAGSDYLMGGNGNDQLSGGDGDDFLDGGAGVDRMSGGAGNDVYFVDNARDSLSDTDGVDTVQSTINYTLGRDFENLTLLGTATTGAGNASDNVLQGNDSDNVLSGMDGNDTIYAGAGDDTLIGGYGADTMSGEAGADTFVLDDPDASPDCVDTITDFNVAEGDALDLKGILDGFDVVNSALADFVQMSQDADGNTLVSVNADGNTETPNFVTFAVLQGVTGLDAQTMFDNGNLMVS